MNLEAFKEIAATNYWSWLFPEMFLVGLALVLLVFEMIFNRKDLQLIIRVALGGQVLLLVVLCLGYIDGFPVDHRVGFGGLLQQNAVTEIMRLFFLIGSILATYLATIYLEKQKLPHTEFLVITILMTASLMLLVQSHQFVLLFVALETVTVGFYVLVAYCRKSIYSLEAGLKYLILGALSSAILLFGIVLLYGVSSNPNLTGAITDGFNFAQLGEFIAQNPSHPLVVAGVILVLAGIAFKIGAVPFQIWIPDVYQGAPTPVAALLAVSSKAAGFIVLLILVKGPFSHLDTLLIPLLSAIAVVTILFGNLAALSQKNVKRMMGLSGIAHAGYLLVGVVAAMTIDWAVYAILFYLITYLLASFGVFGVMTWMSCNNDADQEMDHYSDLARRQPFLAGVLTIGLGSLAGIPPLGGFIAKLLLLIAAYQAGLFALIAVMLLGVVLSIYYYFSWIREAVFRVWRAPKSTNPQASADHGIAIELPKSFIVTLGAISILTIALGLFPQLIPFFFTLL